MQTSVDDYEYYRRLLYIPSQGGFDHEKICKNNLGASNFFDGT